jgi:hypothetical protein
MWHETAWGYSKTKAKSWGNYKRLLIPCIRPYEAEATKCLQDSDPSDKYIEFCLELWEHTQLGGGGGTCGPTDLVHVLATA